MSGDGKRLWRDTSLEAQEVLLAIYRDMPASRKLALVEEANHRARLWAWSGLKSRHPGESEARLRRRLFGLELGEELATKVWGPLEDVP
jgi:hypothetical protein